MSQAVRQSELFAGEDWLVLYRAFTEVNFNASDPPSINAALREYIQTNYPEDFNDWIESSEFVALIDLLSWLAGTLAFKTDINARENFLETAEARESLLRLARFLSYNPRRNQPAVGLLKIMEVETDDDVTDSLGTNLNGVVVQWDNPDDPDWMERFTLIMNNAFVMNNQFGQPLKSGMVSSVNTQSYRINTRFAGVTPTFSATVSGQSMNFELCNGDFDSSTGYSEREPNPDSAFDLYYRADGNGNESANTGFFFLFKQGSLQKQTFSITTPVENQLLDINTNGINDSDVWVQTVSDTGGVITSWTKVPVLLGENITFNSVATAVRAIFTVVTRDNDQISVRFSDGQFGAAPVGNIRVWYRISNGMSYQIRPQEINRVRIGIPYVNRNGATRNLFVTVTLQAAVSNSSSRETDAQVRQRAPSVYASQNRMVSGEDYNTFPLQSNVAVKLKAVNRIYSGHSRFIDINDPTGTYQDVNVFSDDGRFFKERNDVYYEVPLLLNRTPAEMVASYIQPAVQSTATINFMQDYLIGQMVTLPNGVTWVQSTAAKYSSTGSFSGLSSTAKFLVGAALQVTSGGFAKWVSIGNITGSITSAPATGTPGPVTLSEAISTGATVTKLIPRYLSTLDGDTVTAIETKIANNQSFTIWYDYSLVAPWSVGVANGSSVPNMVGTNQKLVVVDYVSGGLWRITSNGLRYIFESTKNVQWYFGANKTVDSITGAEVRDVVRVFGTNPDLNSNTGLGLKKDYDLWVSSLVYYGDGQAEPRRVEVVFADSDADGQPDQPDSFANIITTGIARHLFWHKNSSGTLDPYTEVVVFETAQGRLDYTLLPASTVVYQLEDDTFWSVDGSNNWTRLHGTYVHQIGRGSNVARRWFDSSGNETSAPDGSLLNFQWKHFAPIDNRIDPAKTNVIDIFVLTSEYDYLTRQWAANSGDPALIPLPPSEVDLRLAFQSFEDYKMFSDHIVWRPVQYKLLFGNGAINELRAQFKVVKLISSTLSDGEIKSRVIRAINDYFNVNLWDFGETFYFTELSAYIHQQLAGVIASIVIVPLDESSSFGEGFEVQCRSDELFLSTAQVQDVVIITSNTPANLRIR